MPLYEYKCLKCLKEITELQKHTDEPLKICVLCGGDLKKILSLCNPDVDYKNNKEYYEKVIKPDAKRIANKIKGGDENAAADIFGEPKK